MPDVAVPIVQSECICSITADRDGPAQRGTVLLEPQGATETKPHRCYGTVRALCKIG
jgi:hypothetical protein